ncbi:MAG TPA: hypothetical protein VLG50_00095 [Candidatus Saccharimonadales bacterium]|nr:hypothetical protein [Candidatus Saccharimonadales bacterium]
MSMYLHIQRNVASLKHHTSAKYVKEFLIGMTILVVLGGGYFINKIYKQHREERAFVALSEVVDSFTQSQRATQGLDVEKDKEKIEQAWQDTQTLLDALQKEHMSSYLAPYFLVFKSQIVLEKSSDVDQAIKILDEALAQMTKGSDMYNLFLMKRIKMGFDSKQEEVRKQALQDLHVMAQNVSNSMYQEALYELGLYYMHVGDVEKSQEAFKKLVDSADTSALLSSPWIQKAQEKITTA